jgi:hypothetical protein
LAVHPEIELPSSATIPKPNALNEAVPSANRDPCLPRPHGNGADGRASGSVDGGWLRTIRITVRFRERTRCAFGR